MTDSNIERYTPAEEGLHPMGGLAFHTFGHYGSAEFDPLNGSELEIVLCDPCVAKADKRLYPPVDDKFRLIPVNDED